MNRLVAGLSIRVGEIRLEDVQRQTRLVAGEYFEVVALRANGTPLAVRLCLTEKWGARSWHVQLGCPRCGLPCRRLRDRGGNFCCARCEPSATRHQQLKNCRYWTRYGGRTTAEVVQQLVDGDAPRPSARLEELALTLMHGAMARAEALFPNIYASLDTADDVLRHREPEERE